MSIDKKAKSPFATGVDTIDGILLNHYDDVATRWEEKAGSDRSKLARRTYLLSGAALLASSFLFPGNAGAACIAFYKAVAGHYPTRMEEEKVMAKFRLPSWVSRLVDQVGLQYGKMVAYMGVISIPLLVLDVRYLEMAALFVTAGLGMRWWAQANYLSMSRKPVGLPPDAEKVDAGDSKPHAL